jgi:hypothetical protein
MRMLVLFTAATILTVAAAASTMKAPAPATSDAASPHAVMYIEEIQRKVDMKSLPIVDVKEPY